MPSISILSTSPTAAENEAGWIATKLRADKALQIVLCRAERLRNSESLKGSLLSMMDSLDRETSTSATSKWKQVAAIVEAAEQAEADGAEAASLAEAEVVAPWNGWDEDEDHEDTLDLDVPMRGRMITF